MQSILARRGLRMARQCLFKFNDVEFAVPVAVLLLLCLDAFCIGYDAATGEFNSIWTGLASLFLVPSLLLTLIVGIGMMWRQRSWRQRAKSLGKLAALIALVTVHIYSLPYVRSLGVRARVHLVSDEDRLQAWAEEIIKTPVKKLPLRPHTPAFELLKEGDLADAVPPYELNRLKLPAFVKRVSIPGGPMYEEDGKTIAGESVYVDEDNGNRYVRLVVRGGRPQEYGILLADPAFRPSPQLNDRYALYYWRDGLYAYWVSPSDSGPA